MKTRILTRRAMVYRSFRLLHKDVELWQSAALVEQISQSEFLRRAIRQRAERILKVRTK
jgi:hypothetical protein